MTDAFPPKIGAPAARALANAGITSPADLATWSEADLATLHGIGPKSLAILRDALAQHGMAFRSDGVGDADVDDPTDAEEHVVVPRS